jgi:hypothetical protein|tara:strand:- start:7514 stop:8335 length:822 start_codon:yes stop_codon:yes gene_type:complete
MKSDPKYCLECQKQQIERAVTLGKVSEEVKQEALKYSKEHIQGIPATEGTVFHRLIMKETGKNPFAGEKQEGTEAATEILKEVEPTIKTLKDACRSAVAGNFVDVVTVRSEQELENVADAFNIKLAIDDFDKAKKYFQKGKKILYLTDNCGEHLFDLLFIKKIEADVIVAGKESDITNDATVTDLKEAGYEKYCKVISIGTDCIGTNLVEASEEFLKEFETADLVIAKGMGHYETLSENPRRILFMLKAKCEPVANDLGVELDQNVLKFKESA